MGLLNFGDKVGGGPLSILEIRITPFSYAGRKNQCSHVFSCWLVFHDPCVYARPKWLTSFSHGYYVVCPLYISLEGGFHSKRRTWTLR